MHTTTTPRTNGHALTTHEHHRLAEVLLKASRDRRAIAPLTASFPELTESDAARIRDTSVVARIAGGERLIGAKVSVGASVDGQPRLGWLTDGMLLGSSEADVAGLISPRVEAKVAFRLARRLHGRVRDVSDLLALTDAVAPCLEITDARYDAPANRLDDIADNCAAAMLLLGEAIAPPPLPDLLRVRARLGGVSSAVGSSPVDATLWLANRVVEEDGELEPGSHLVTSPLCLSAPFGPGARVGGDFGLLGALSVEARFRASAPAP